MMLFAVLTIIFLDTAVIAADNAPAIDTDNVNLAENACTKVAVWSGRFPQLTVETLAGPIRDDKTGRDYIGCRVVSVGDGIEYRDDKWPHDILRMNMLAHDWQEDISRAADGAGSTAFAVSKDAALCVFSAIWITEEPFEPVTSKAGNYRVEVICFAADNPV
jgi:hypothetical protein